jgi:transglutaminase-like putative cysteine protease
VRYQIRHTTTYTYEQAAVLDPHVLRLRPRSDGMQTLDEHHLELRPEPLGMTPMLDVEGNAIARCWWPPHPIQTLTITATSVVTTHTENPFHYLLEPWATEFPIDYPRSIGTVLMPYLASANASLASQLAQEIAVAVNWNTVEFLSALNQHIYDHCQYQERSTGPPWPPDLTWARRTGSCRDFVVLFMAACRSVGLAARFVSGYEQGDPAYAQTLHAWAEVYLPGAGWRGYDPTLGLVVCDRHITLVTSHHPRDTVPISGIHRPGCAATLKTEVFIQPLVRNNIAGR